MMNIEPTPANRTNGHTSAHQMANELTDDASLQAEGKRPESARSPRSMREERPNNRAERRVARSVLLVTIAAAIIGCMVSALLFDQLILVGVGALFVIPFILLVSAPVWLASTTKQAQDETVREQRQG